MNHEIEQLSTVTPDEHFNEDCYKEPIHSEDDILSAYNESQDNLNAMIY